MINTIRQIKQGNSKAFKAIFDRYWNIVYRFTGLYLMDNYEKEEITQQVFIKLWEKRELLDEEKDLDGLLFIITRNLIFNHIRKSINEEKLAETLQLATEASNEIEQGIEAEDLKKYIDKLVHMLPERQRTAFILSKKRGLKVKEIAEEVKKQMDLTIDKKKVQLKEAIRTLGTHTVPVKLHPKVTAELKVVVKEEA